MLPLVLMLVEGCRAVGMGRRVWGWYGGYGGYRDGMGGTGMVYGGPTMLRALSPQTWPWQMW